MPRTREASLSHGLLDDDLLKMYRTGANKHLFNPADEEEEQSKYIIFQYIPIQIICIGIIFISLWTE